ncbi:MAG: hypothetical protein ACYC1K_00245 [Minisyncoccota bacterium]
MKRILSIFILSLLVPQVVMAAWWNPTSWLKQKSSNIEKAIDETKPTQQEVLEAASVQRSVQEKIIERVITVSDPKLQLQINDLIKENAELKTKLNTQSSIVSQLNQCKADLADSKSKSSGVTVSSEYQDKKDKWAKLDNDLTELVNSAVDNSETMSVGKIISTREKINEIIKAYQYIDSRTNLKTIPDFLSPGGQGARDKFKNAYIQLRSDLDWYIKYR